MGLMRGSFSVSVILHLQVFLLFILELIVLRIEIDVTLVYDPQSFSTYDGGEELRRISALAFDKVTEGEPINAFNVRYQGCTPVHSLFSLLFTV